MLLIIVIGYILIIMLASVRPHRPRASLYELKRRAADGASAAQRNLLRHEMWSYVESAQVVGVAMLLAVVFAVSVLRYGWTVGVVSTLAMVVLLSLVVRIAAVRRLAVRWYNSIEGNILVICKSLSRVSKPFRVPGFVQDAYEVQSTEELRHIVQSASFLLPRERDLIERSLAFGGLTVRDIMKPWKTVPHVKTGDFLGPLVLHDLHASGETHFVALSPNGEAVGVLDISPFVSLDEKKSVYVHDVMDADLLDCEPDTPLIEALKQLIAANKQLAVVTEDERVVGVLYSRLACEALIGSDKV